MMSGVRASSMRIESTSSTMAYTCPRWVFCSLCQRHVVAEVVEAELVVRAVRDVAGVLRTLVVAVVVAGDDQSDRQAEPAVDLTHPVGVAARQVVVDGDDVHAPAGDAVEVGRQGRHERLSFARLHLGDPAEVECGAAHQLHVEVTLADRALRPLARDGERLDQEIVEVLAVVETLTELDGLAGERVV